LARIGHSVRVGARRDALDERIANVIHSFDLGPSREWVSLLGTTVHVRVSREPEGLRSALVGAVKPRRVVLRVQSEEELLRGMPIAWIRAAGEKMSDEAVR